MKNIAAIILAAGKGRRMKSKDVNKVVIPLGNKQMILHTIDRLKELMISPIVVVVGFAKESVIKVLEGNVIFAHQSRRLGTAHAVAVGLKKVPEDIDTVLVLNGDDSAFYTISIIEKLIEAHVNKNAALSFLTITVDNPIGLGRVIRDNNDKVIGIVEEKDATRRQRKITEINPACYVFEVEFLKKYQVIYSFTQPELEELLRKEDLIDEEDDYPIEENNEDKTKTEKTQEARHEQRKIIGRLLPPRL